MRWLLPILTGLLATSLHAATLDARLIRGSPELTRTDAALSDLAPKLQKLFGYDHYRQLGRRVDALTPGDRKLLNLGEGFTIFITPKSTAGRTHTVELEWYSGKVALVKTTLNLTESTPVLIKGPEVGRDWIILALTIAP